MNLLIPGPVEAVTAGAVATTIDTPSVEELLVSVREFLRDDVRAIAEGRTNFLALVASNSLDIVHRELQLGPDHRRREARRLRGLLGVDAPLDELRWRLTRGLRDGSISLEHPGLTPHLRSTVVNQVAIDQPRYSGHLAAIEH